MNGAGQMNDEGEGVCGSGGDPIMDEKDRWLTDTLGEIRESVGRIEGAMTRLPCPGHSSDIAALRADVEEIRGKDLPEIRQRLAILDWWKSGRNRIIAALLVAILGVIGAVIGDIAKDAIRKPIPAAEAHYGDTK
jgi:hypothetical protein